MDVLLPIERHTHAEFADGQPFVGATTEMMEVVKRYRGERRRFYTGGYMGQKRRELVRRVGYDAKNAI